MTFSVWSANHVSLNDKDCGIWQIHTTANERQKLIKMGKGIGRAIEELITIVTPTTFFRWLRDEKGSKSKTKNPKVGQRKPRELRELVIEIAKTTGFGYTRIIGELRKLGLKNMSRQTVRNILKEEEIQPGPDRTSDSWTEFLNRHGETLWASDFFSVKSMTARGLRDIYVMVFLNLQTREAIVTESTYRPNSAWVCKQTKKFTEETRDREKRPTIMIHDRDTKYTKKFRETLKAAGMKTNPLLKASPNLNGRCERLLRRSNWNASTSLLCLARSISIISQSSLRVITTQKEATWNGTTCHRFARSPMKWRQFQSIRLRLRNTLAD